MEGRPLGRREFLQLSAAGATVLASGQAFGAGTKQPELNIYVCGTCEHVELSVLPDACPVCHAARAAFKQDNALFSDNEAKNNGLSISHNPVVFVRKDSSLIREQTSYAVTFRIGRTLHPMTESHLIRFADCYVDDRYQSRIMLTAGVMPAAVFYVKTPGIKARIVSKCNLHGYWQSEAGVP